MRIVYLSLKFQRSLSLFFLGVMLTFLAALMIAQEEIYRGAPDAPVTLVEYGSLTCDHCISFHRKILPKLTTEFIDTGRVRFIFRDYPTSETAHLGAVAARCAGDRYYEMLDLLFLTVAQWVDADDVEQALTVQAKQLGLAEKEFASCLADKANRRAIFNAQKNAVSTFDVTGTPSFLINGELVRGKRTLEEMVSLLQDALKPPAAK